MGRFWSRVSPASAESALVARSPAGTLTWGQEPRCGLSRPRRLTQLWWNNPAVQVGALQGASKHARAERQSWTQDMRLREPENPTELSVLCPFTLQGSLKSVPTELHRPCLARIHSEPSGGPLSKVGRKGLQCKLLPSAHVLSYFWKRVQNEV